MKKYVIFYYLAFGYDKVLVDAESLRDAISISNAFKRKYGAVIVGICLESVLSMFCHE